MGRSVFISHKGMVPGILSAQRQRIKSEKELRCQTAAQAGMLKQKLSREHGVKLEELESLKKIYILYMKKGQAVSRISDEQEELLKKIGVDMSMC